MMESNEDVQEKPSELVDQPAATGEVQDVPVAKVEGNEHDTQESIASEDGAGASMNEEGVAKEDMSEKENFGESTAKETPKQEASDDAVQKKTGEVEPDERSEDTQPVIDSQPIPDTQEIPSTQEEVGSQDVTSDKKPQEKTEEHIPLFVMPQIDYKRTISDLVNDLKAKRDFDNKTAQLCRMMMSLEKFSMNQEDLKYVNETLIPNGLRAVLDGPADMVDTSVAFAFSFILRAQIIFRTILEKGPAVTPDDKKLVLVYLNALVSICESKNHQKFLRTSEFSVLRKGIIKDEEFTSYLRVPENVSYGINEYFVFTIMASRLEEEFRAIAINHVLCSFQHFKAILAILHCCTKSAFLVDHHGPLHLSVSLTSIGITWLSDITEEDIRGFVKEQMDNCFKILSYCQKYPMTEDTSERLEILLLEVALRCIKSGTIDKRVYGVRCLTSVTNWFYSYATADFNQYHFVTAPFFADWLINNRIIETIFDTSAQVEMIKESTTIIRFLFAQKECPSSLPEVVWKSILTLHESISDAILHVLDMSCYSFCWNIQSFFISKIEDTDPSKLTRNIISLYQTLTERTSSSERCLKFLNGLIVQRIIPTKIRPAAESAIKRTIKYLPVHVSRSPWINYYVSLVANHLVGEDIDEYCVLLSLKCIKLLLKPFGSNYTLSELETIRSFLNQLHPVKIRNETEQWLFVDMMINEIISCLQRSVSSECTKAMTDKAVAGDEEVGKTPGCEDGFVARLDFLSWLLSKVSEIVPLEQFLQVKDAVLANFNASHTESFLSWTVSCSSSKPAVISPEESLAVITSMVPFAENGLMTCNCFKSLWRLVLFMNGSSDPSKVDLDSFKYFDCLSQLIFSTPDTSVYEEGKRCIMSLSPSSERSQNPRDESLINLLKHAVKKAYEELQNANDSPVMGEDVAQDADREVRARQLARAIELLDSVVKHRNDAGYNSFFIKNSSISSKKAVPITVSVVLQGMDPVKIDTLSTETFSGFRSSVSLTLKPLCPTLDVTKIAFFVDGFFIPSSDQFEIEDRRTLKDLGIRNGTELRAVAPDDISQRKTKLIVRSGGSGALDSDTDFNGLEQNSDGRTKPSSPEKAQAMVDSICKKASIDQDFAVFLFDRFGWNEKDAIEVLENPKEIPKVQADYEEYKKKKDASSAAHKPEKILKPSFLAEYLISDAGFVNELSQMILSKHDCVASAAWQLMQHVPLPPEVLNSLCLNPVDPRRFATDTPFFLLYNLRMVEFVLCSPPLSDQINGLLDNGILAYITSTLFPELISSLSPALKESLAICESIVGLVAADSRSTTVTLPQTLSVLSFIGNDSSSTESDSVIVSHIFELLSSSARVIDRGVEQILDGLFVVKAEDERSLAFKLLVQHTDRLVRLDTADGIMSLLSSTEDSNSRTNYYVQCLNKLLPFISDNSLCTTYSTQSAQLFDLIAALYTGLTAASDTGAMTSLEELVRSNFALWVKAMFNSPIVEVFSRHGNASTDTVDSFLSGMMTVLRHTMALFPSTKGKLFGPSEVRRVVEDILFRITSTLQPKCLPKAKQESTRAAAMDLLTEAMADCPENAAVVADYLNSDLQTWVQDHVFSSECNKSWSYNPTLYGRSELGFVGLRNTGNLCYLNSVMQQLFHIPQLRRAILSIDAKNLKCSDNHRRFVIEFQKLFYSMEHSEQREVNPRSFLTAFAKVTDYFEETQQHDADEFFNLLWQRLERALDGSPEWKAINSIFAGSLQHEIKSMDETKPYVQHTREDFHVLSLEIASKKTLEEALEGFIQPDKLSGENAYYCSEFNCKVDASKHAMLQHLPPVLAVHLKRFDYNPAQDRMVKLHDKLEFPKVISLKNFTVDDESDQSSTRFQYRLRGVIVHSGECQSGHYYSFINTFSPLSVDPVSGKQKRVWHKFNDSEVELFSEDQLEVQCFGGKKTESVYNGYTTYDKEVPRTNSAYMVFYERCDLNDAVGEDESSLESQTADMVLGDPVVAPPAAAAAAAAAAATESAPEDINLPNVVNAENVKYIHERFLCSPSLFSFISSLWYHHQQPCDPRVLAAMFLEVVCRSCVKEHFVSAWANHLSLLLEKNPELAVWYLEQVVSREVLKTHVIPRSPTELVRIKVADTIVAAMKSAMPLEKSLWSRYEEIKLCDIPARRAKLHQVTPVLDLMDQLFHLLDFCREHWQTFNQYFFLFHEFAKLGPEARTLLMEANIANLFCDWYHWRGYKANVMNNSYFPDLREFFNALMVIWCGCYQGPEENGTTPYSIEPLVKPLKKFKHGLFYRDFFQSAVFHPYNTLALSHIGCHACYNDPELSAVLLKYCLLAMKESRLPASRISCAILDVDDSFKDARMNYFLTSHVLKCKISLYTGVLGALQLSNSNRSPNDFLNDLQLLEHCCRSEFGFAIVLESRKLVDWLDGLCVSKILKEMSANPDLFERLCLDEDWKLLDTPEGKKYTDMDIVKSFRIVRGLVHRMDSLGPAELKEYYALLARRRADMLNQAASAAHSMKPFIMQPEWSNNARRVKCGRYSSPENPFKSSTDTFSGNDPLSANNNNANSVAGAASAAAAGVTAVSASDIEDSIAKAREVLRDALDEERLRNLLKQRYTLDEAIGMMLT